MVLSAAEDAIISRMTDGDVTIRRAEPVDRAAIIDLCQRSLNWDPKDPNEAFYSWKHDQNPFGVSPTWVACTEDGSIIGLRVFLRWRFVDGGGDVIEAVRAVDTATDPAYRGRGIFSRLTLGALDALASEGIGLIFNTPNAQSRPGYVKMGWRAERRVTAAVRPSALRRAHRILGANRPASLWSERTQAGQPIAVLESDRVGLEALIAAQGLPANLRTNLSPEFFAWRYGFEPLQYRAWLLGPRARDGFFVFRLRRRGEATEMVVASAMLPPDASSRSVRSQLRYAIRSAGADYALGTAATVSWAQGFAPIERIGPILALRYTANTEPVPYRFDFALGDIELF